MKTLALIAAATAVIATSTVASAHDYDRQDRIDARRAEQAYRIRHYRHTGEADPAREVAPAGRAAPDRRHGAGGPARRLHQPARGARHRPGAGCRRPRHLRESTTGRSVVAAGVVVVVSDPPGLTPCLQPLTVCTMVSDPEGLTPLSLGDT